MQSTTFSDQLSKGKVISLRNQGIQSFYPEAAMQSVPQTRQRMQERLKSVWFAPLDTVPKNSKGPSCTGTFCDFFYNYQYIFIGKRFHLPREGCLSFTEKKGEHDATCSPFFLVERVSRKRQNNETVSNVRYLFNCRIVTKSPLCTTPAFSDNLGQAVSMGQTMQTRRSTHSL